mgnify:CR=1 FL=1
MNSTVADLMSALAAGQADAAVQSYRDALRLDPNFAPAYTNLANALMQAGQATEARDVLHQCLEIHPGNCKALAYLAAAAGETIVARFNSTQDVYAGLSDPPGGSTPGSNCMVILLKCGTVGEMK